MIPVFAGHAHHVGHSADGGQRAIAPEGFIGLLRPRQGHGQLQRHAHAGQIFEGVGAVAAVGIHHRHGPGQCFLAFVVVG